MHHQLKRDLSRLFPWARHAPVKWVVSLCVIEQLDSYNALSVWLYWCVSTTIPKHEYISCALTYLRLITSARTHTDSDTHTWTHTHTCTHESGFESRWERYACNCSSFYALLNTVQLCETVSPLPSVADTRPCLLQSIHWSRLQTS